MAGHKFSVGQVVDFVGPRLSMPSVGRYEIMRLLPSDGAQFQYRIKGVGQSFERIATEGQLSRPPSDDER